MSFIQELVGYIMRLHYVHAEGFRVSFAAIMWKHLIRAGIVLVILYLGFVGYVWWAMNQAPETFGGVMKRLPGVAYILVPFETMWMHARAGHLRAGDAAPDFLLTKLDKSATVQLSALAATQPVVLVFGSYT